MGKVVFITGGASGIGLGLTLACLEAGMSVGLGYRGERNLADARPRLAHAGDRVRPVHVDVTDRSSVEAAAAQTAEAFGAIHVLINNAGIQNTARLGEMTYEDWGAMMATNVDGVFTGVHEVLPYLRRHGERAHILTTSSILGLYSVGGVGAYTASKFAVTGMMEVLRQELAETPIGVSIYCPGPVRSRLEDWLVDFEHAADPLEMGRLAVRGMMRNDLYILTHPQGMPLAWARAELLRESTLADGYAGSPGVDPAELVARSLYGRRDVWSGRD